MSARPKDIGTAGETAVVRAARRLGFPNADRLPLTGSKDRGDVGLCPGVVVEVKAGQAAKMASDGQVALWLAETERERVNAGAAVAFLVTQRAGVGPANAHRWWAHLTTHCLGLPRLGIIPTPATPVRMVLADALTMLRSAGYGEPLEAVAS